MIMFSIKQATVIQIKQFPALIFKAINQNVFLLICKTFKFKTN